MEQEAKSLARWKFELQTLGRKHWGVFYESLLGAPLTSYPRFFKALNNYGMWPVFEAIVASSNQNISGDPLGYVLKVAHEMWKTSQKEIDAKQEYDKEIQYAIDLSQEANRALAKKLGK